VPLRSIIVDDELQARELLKEILATRPDVEIVGMYGDARQAIGAIKKDQPDLIFLDIQMPGRDGFSILEALGDVVPPTIFVTAFDNYAIQAFDVAAIDYVLKPLDEERVHRAVDRAMARSNAGKATLEPSAVTSLLREIRVHRDEYLRFLPVSVREKVMLIRVGDITWFEAEGKYVRLYTLNEQHMIRHTMHSLEAKLDPAKFLRVSRSGIVNIEMVSHLEPWAQGEWRISLRSGHHVTSTHGYRERLQRLLRPK
jgi:two-component system LytT family response regulator